MYCLKRMVKCSIQLPSGFSVLGHSERHRFGKKPSYSAFPTASSSSLMPISPTSAFCRSPSDTRMRAVSRFQRSSSCSSTTCVGVG